MRNTSFLLWIDIVGENEGLKILCSWEAPLHTVGMVSRVEFNPLAELWR